MTPIAPSTPTAHISASGSSGPNPKASHNAAPIPAAPKQPKLATFGATPLIIQHFDKHGINPFSFCINLPEQIPAKEHAFAALPAAWFRYGFTLLHVLNVWELHSGPAKVHACWHEIPAPPWVINQSAVFVQWVQSIEA